LHARAPLVTRQGVLLYTSTAVNPVLTRGAPGEVSIALQRATHRPVPHRTLGNTYWKLTRLGASAVEVAPSQRKRSLVLHADKGQVAGSGGCNRFSGSYTSDGSALSFGSLASTRMACAVEMEQEAAFLASLGRVRSWRIRGDGLELLGADGSAVARVQAVDLQ